MSKISTGVLLNAINLKDLYPAYCQNSEIQCPTWGYATADAYYRDASSADAMLAIKVPFLAIQAEDDPVREW